MTEQGDNETDEHYLARLRAELTDVLRRLDTAEELLHDSRKREAELDVIVRACIVIGAVFSAMSIMRIFFNWWIGDY